jgi:ParB-like chromosome segregation protein Spo0J
MLMNLQENLQRVNLDVIQEGQAIQRLLDEGVDGGKGTQALAKLLNRNVAWVDTKLQAIKLPAPLHKDIIEGKFTAKNVRELYKSMTTKSVEDFYADVRWLKDERYKGKKNVTLA